MKIKVSESEGIVLNYLVAKCKGKPWPDNAAKFLVEQYFKPSTDWAHGGPIIEQEKIDITNIGETYRRSGFRDAVHARIQVDVIVSEYGPTPLIAAMRCYVVSKLGDVVDVPDELMGVSK